ncbi:RagB/SusD family nutrient uptake outer membrane protein [Pedobacter psychrodurus]
MGNIPWNSTRLVFPIPQREIDANTKLVQNPGY